MWSRSRNSITTTFPNEPPSVPCLPFYRPWSSLNPPRPHWLAAESNEPLTGVLRANTLNWHRLLLFSFLFFDFCSRSRCCSWWINYGRIYFSLKEETKWAPVSPHSPSHISFNIILTFACPPTPSDDSIYLHFISIPLSFPLWLPLHSCSLQTGGPLRAQIDCLVLNYIHQQ